MSDLTQFSLAAHGAQFDTMEGRMVNTPDGVVPETYLLMKLNDGYVFILEAIFVGRIECDEDGFDSWLRGDTQAMAKANAFRADGQVDLTQWSSYAAPGDAPANNDAVHDILTKIGGGLW